MRDGVSRSKFRIDVFEEGESERAVMLELPLCAFGAWVNNLW